MPVPFVEVGQIVQLERIQRLIQGEFNLHFMKHTCSVAEGQVEPAVCDIQSVRVIFIFSSFWMFPIHCVLPPINRFEQIKAIDRGIAAAYAAYMAKGAQVGIIRLLCALELTVFILRTLRGDLRNMEEMCLQYAF